MLFSPNESMLKRNATVLWCEFRVLPQDYCEQMVQLTHASESDRRTHIIIIQTDF
jgi:hypothetical protein